MQTSTNLTPNMHPFLSPRSNTAHAVLQRGGLVLLPTANLWQTIALPQFSDTIARQLELCQPSADLRAELLFPDLEMMREWFPRLHPKLETLLMFHNRPLTILIPANNRLPAGLTDHNNEVAIRLIRDSYCHGLAEDLDSPLVAVFAKATGSNFLPLSFGRVRSDVLQGVDHVVRRRQKDLIAEAPAVTIRLDEQDEVVFL